MTVTEGNIGTSTATFTVTLSSASTQTVTVNYATADGTAIAGSDFQSSSGILTFSPGQTSKTISVLVNGDRVGEWDEYFLVDIRNPSSAKLTGFQALASIVDDEPRIRLDSGMVVEGNSGTKLLTFTVSLSQVSSKTVQVSYATVNGTAKTSDKDYTARSGTLYFAPGETTKSVSVVINGDTRQEKNEYFYVRLSNATNSTIATGQATGSIWNDDGVNAGSSRLSFSSVLDEGVEDILTGRSKKRRR